MSALIFSALLMMSAGAVPSECAEAPPIPEPPIGLALVFETDKGIELRENLGRTVDDSTEYEKFVVGKASDRKQHVGASGRFSRIRGVVPVESTAEKGVSQRIKTYEKNPLDAMVGLRVGETVTLAGTEISTFDGQTRQMDTPLALTFLGCFTEDIAGAPERLLKYKVTSSGRKPEKSGPDSVYRTTKTVAVSARLGWWLYAESEGGRLVATSIGFN